MVIGVAVVALAIVATLVVLTGDRDVASYDESTPEGVLQRYLAAFDASDLERAHAYFSSDVQADMDAEAFERVVEMYGAHGTETTRRVLFDDRAGDGDRVRLQLTVEELYGEGLGASTSRYQREIRMVREDGAWRIDEPLVWLEPAPIEARP